MTSWSGVPEQLRRDAERYLAAHVHRTMATLRADGSPRISGTEVVVADGELWLGSMPGARKAADLLRDPRVALHSGSEDPPGWTGDAKVSGRTVVSREWAQAFAHTEHGAREQGDAHLFRLDVTDVAVVEQAGDHLVVRWWTPEGGLQSVERR